MPEHRDRIRDYFGFTAPDEFFSFWEFAKSVDAPSPLYAFEELTMITMCGPFSVLAGDFETRQANYDPCLHWRYFGDPPELVTILTGGTDGLHWGYVIDQPQDGPQGIVGYFAGDDVTVFQESSSLFQMLENHLERTLKEMRLEVSGNKKLAKDKRFLIQMDECEDLLDNTRAFVRRHRLSVPETNELTFVDHCNPPPPFEFPAMEDFDKLPQLVEIGIRELMAQGYTVDDARLKIGRLLWHWHYDGNSQLETIAFDLLDKVYATLDRKFLQHVLRQHREHRHRQSLNIFE